ncbi:unnamed protein product, partial [Heterosigma akashiwo]
PDSEQPFRVITFDFGGPYGTDKRAFKHCLVIVDCFSRFVWLVPTKSTTSKEVKKAFRERIIPLVGVPSFALVDQQSSFMSKDFQNFCDKAGMLLRPIPQGSSDSLGLAERTIRSVNNHIRRLV